jgi:hypothetical protein
MTKSPRAIAFAPDSSDLARPFWRLGATSGERAGSGKRPRPGIGAQKIGCGSAQRGTQGLVSPIGDANAEMSEIPHRSDLLHPQDLDLHLAGGRAPADDVAFEGAVLPEWVRACFAAASCRLRRQTMDSSEEAGYAR